MIDGLLAINSREDSLKPLYRSLLIFFVIALVGMVGRIFWRLTFARMTHVYGRELKNGIWDSLRGAKIDEISKFTLGDLMNRSIGDVNSARWIFGITMVLTCDVVFYAVLGSASMIYIHPQLAIICLLSFLIIPPVGLFIAKREYVAHDKAQDELTVLSEHVSQAVRGVRAQRASDSFGMWVKALNLSAEKYSGLRLSAQKVSIFGYPFFSIPTLFSYCVILIYGTRLVVGGSITVGEFTAISSYVYLLQGPLGEIGELISEWQRGFASLKRINEIHGLKQRSNDAPGSISARQIALECREIQIKRRGVPILSDVNLTVGSGEWVGVTASVGGGKSTLLRVLSGIESPAAGSVRVNSKIISGPLSYVPERPFIFSGTVRKNLSLHEQFSDQELWKILSIVQMKDQIVAMGGLDSVVGEGGVTLSGGQKQRLSLARSLLRANGLIIMDDPISAVDSDTEQKIISAIKSEFSGHAVIMASNKRPTLDCCDRIFAMEERDSQTSPKDMR
jgi:ATP-binding cassette subfamily B protein